MDAEKRLALIRRNVVEVLTEPELMELLRKKTKPVVYCGYEPSGPLHLGHFVTITKLQELEKAGFKVKILLADVHAFLNRKGAGKEIAKEVNAWKKTIKAIGLKAEIVLGSSFQFQKDYQLDVIKLAQKTTINRGLRCMQEIARDIEHATISQLLYPLMQIVDVKHLQVDLALGGLEQRKVHVLGREEEKLLGWNYVALHTPLITSLKDPGEKMSKSVPGSGIAVTDSYDEIKRTLQDAYCPEKIIENNPVLQIVKLIIFPRIKSIKIVRPAKFGGVIEFSSYNQLEIAYKEGKLHPLDLKNAVIEHLEKIIAPIRKNFR
ncbi:MAG: tyrosine--tRNA ligase [Candidatus Pacearchaeota archaeon]